MDHHRPVSLDGIAAGPATAPQKAGCGVWTANADQDGEKMMMIGRRKD